jgi:hypothetical protein
MVTLKIDDYMAARLVNTAHKMYPEDGDDITTTVGMLLLEHEALKKIEKEVARFL